MPDIARGKNLIFWKKKIYVLAYVTLISARFVQSFGQQTYKYTNIYMSFISFLNKSQYMNEELYYTIKPPFLSLPYTL